MKEWVLERVWTGERADLGMDWVWREVRERVFERVTAIGLVRAVVLKVERRGCGRGG